MALEQDGRFDRPCTGVGFAFARLTESWRGDHPSLGTNNVEIRTEVAEIDELGRPLRNETPVCRTEGLSETRGE